MNNQLCGIPMVQRRKEPIARGRQRGFSLIELMVGLTIGLLVALAGVGTLVFTSVAARGNSDVVTLEQDAATLMRVIGRQLKQAGAVPVQLPAATPLNPTPKFSYLSTYTGAVAGAPSPVSILGVDGVSDTLTVAYSISPNGANGVSNCFGAAPDPAATNVVSTFLLNGNSFRCQTPAVGATGASDQPFLDNVEDLQFWYAVRPAAAPTQVQYFTAGNVLDWTAVEAVQVCIRIAGTTLNNTTVATVGCNNEAIPADGRIRRVYRQVFSLRNLQAV